MEKSADKKISDKELFTRFSAGHEDAFYELVNRYKGGLYAFLKRFLNRHELVEDVFQETFLQLYKSRESFDLRRPLRPWLYTIAANKAKDLLRKEQRRGVFAIGTLADSEESSFDDVLNTLKSFEITPYDEVSTEEAAVRVRAIISNMPTNLREILIFAYFNKFSYKQMAEILSIPVGTVKSRLHTAVNRFAKDWKAADRSNDSI